ncbi:probable WRKY transcription factor 3 isoform X1 [Hibiscus syriacus]|uniref:probable WRKY transcription factor 3 isoform X1 n=1 Tax=Hibiscus syriacus TaxID=106335 RepID=UPI0019222E98|nr:probable WRKY transcription factor 3 isoform X1 [Hibiscus syriacus]XP_039011292.1 probable WRKY transcription factor 3 isoform X1 [Hibiscus syriacus]
MAEQGKRSKLSAPTYPTITLPPRPAIDGLFPAGSGLSPGPMTLVSSFFSDPDSTNRPFSQLLAGAMASPGAKLPYNPMDSSFMEMGFESGGEKNTGFKQSRPLNFTVGNSPLFTVPPGLSPSGLLTSPGFFCLSPQSPFGISHQQALAQVTAEAALVQSHVRTQPEYQTLSVAAPLEPSNPHPSINTEETSQKMPLSVSDPQSLAMEYSEASQFDKKNQPSIAVDKPAEDGYNWRKYGQKHIKGCEYPRSYYKCTHLHCPVKKIVERSAEGHITEIVYKSVHNHEKPQPNRQAKGGGDGNTNSQANLELGSQGVAGNLNSLREIVPAHSIPGENHESTQSVELSGFSDGEEGCDEESREERDDDEPNLKRRNSSGEAAVMLSHKTVMDSKIIVQTRSEVDLLDDGYRWRKYGQKVVKGNPHPRSYYKCTSPGCKVRKHVERAYSDPKAVITTYEGKHNHDVPAARNSSHNTVNNSLPPPKQHDVVSEKHSLLQEMEFGKNVQGPAVLRLKEEQVRV